MLEIMIDLDSMDDNQIKNILNSQLSNADKEEMEFMIKNGCSMEEIVTYFKCRAIEDDDTISELSK